MPSPPQQTDRDESTADATPGMTSTKSRRWQQIFKWTVYSLLLINFGLYIVEDVVQARHTLHAGSTLLDITGAFATSTAVLAWFMLLASLELETYVIDDDAWTDRIEKLTHGVRIFSFLIVGHFVFALVKWAMELQTPRPFTEATSLCQLVDKDLSWSTNLEYVVLTPENCGTLTGDSQLQQLGNDPVVTDRAGLALAKQLAWGDVLEIVAWMIIIVAMELMVRLQGRGVTEGRTMSFLRGTKYLFYGVLFCLGFWWASLGHWLYLWDTFLWITGFSVIELNLRLWREEILAKRAAAGSGTPPAQSAATAEP